MQHARNAHLFATDAQRSYLRRLINQANSNHVDIGLLPGQDSRRAIESDYLTKERASQWIAQLKDGIDRKKREMYA